MLAVAKVRAEVWTSMSRFRRARLIKLLIGSSTYAWVGSQTTEHARYRNAYSAGVAKYASGAAGTNQSRNGSDRGVEHHLQPERFLPQSQTLTAYLLGSSARANVGSVRSEGATSRKIESGGKLQGSGGTSSARLQSDSDHESGLMGMGEQFR